MIGRGLAAGAVLALAAAMSSARADAPTVYLGLGNAPTVLASGGLSGGARVITLEMKTDDPAADTVEAWGRRGYGYRGGYGGGYRGWYGGGYRGWYGSYRSNYWGGYRPYYWGGYNCYRPYYWGGYNPYYYSYSYYPYGYNSYGYYWGISLPVEDAAAAPPNGTTIKAEPRNPFGEDADPSSRHGRTPYDADATYPYNGGPKEPVPMPKARPDDKPAPSVPLDGRAVSLPTRQPTRFAYPAYGEEPERKTGFAEDRTTVAKKPAR